MGDVKAISDDPRVEAMASFLVFFMNNYDTKVIVDNQTHQVDSTHAWCRRLLENAGFTLTEKEPPRQKGKKS